MNAESYHLGREPLSLRERTDSLNAVLGELVQSMAATGEHSQVAREASEMLGDTLRKHFISVARELLVYTKKSKEHPSRRVLERADPYIAERITAWTESAIHRVMSCPSPLAEEDVIYLREEIALFWDCVVESINARSIERDINEFLHTEEYAKFGAYYQEELRERCAKMIADTYKMQYTDVLEYIESHKYTKEQKKISPAEALAVLTSLWQRFGTHGDTRRKALYMGGTVSGELLKSFAPASLGSLRVSNNDDNLLMPVAVAGMMYYLGEKVSLLAKDAREDMTLEVRKHLSDALYAALLHKDLAEMDETSLGDMHQLFNESRQAVVDIWQHTMQNVTPATLHILFSLGVVGAFIHPALMLANLANVPILAAVAKRHARDHMRYDDLRRYMDALASTQLGGAKSNIEIIRTGANPAWVEEELLKVQRRVDEVRARANKSMYTAESAAETAKWVAVFFTSVVGYFLFKNGFIKNSGEVVGAAALAANIQMRISEIIKTWYIRTPQWAARIEKLEAFLHTEDGRKLGGDEDAHLVGTDTLVDAGLEVNNLSYNGVFTEYSLKIPTGSFVALTGTSGEGKTTLLRLLQGLRKPNKGAVLIGGVNRKDIRIGGKRDGLQHFVVSCPSRPHIFADTSVRNNCLVGFDTDLTDAQIYTVLKRLQLDAVLPDLDATTPRYLSDGQKTRVGLARAFIRLAGKERGILILDEPTTGLDAPNAAIVRDFLLEVHKEKPNITIICATHDPRLPEVADQTISINKKA